MYSCVVETVDLPTEDHAHPPIPIEEFQAYVSSIRDQEDALICHQYMVCFCNNWIGLVVTASISIVYPSTAEARCRVPVASGVELDNGCPVAVYLYLNAFCVFTCAWLKISPFRNSS